MAQQVAQGRDARKNACAQQIPIHCINKTEAGKEDPQENEVLPPPEEGRWSSMQWATELHREWI